MGVIRRQGIKQSVVMWVAMLIGAVNVFFIFPAALTPEELGIINFVRDCAILVTPFLFWGGTELIVRFFPFFKNETNNHNGFLSLLQFAFLGGIVTLCLLVFMLQEKLLHLFSQKGYLFDIYTPFILPFAILITYGAVFSSHALNFKRAAIPAFFNELGPKIGLTVLATGFFLKWFSFEFIFWGQLAVYGIIVIFQIWYLYMIGELNFRINFAFWRKPLLKEMAVFGLFGLIGSLGSRFAERINSILLPLLSTLADGGIYAIGYFIAEAMDAPRKAIARIASPLLADKWKEGKLSDIEEIYKKSALNQLIVGAALLLILWSSIDYIFQIMPNGEIFAKGKYVVLILGLARLTDMATGINTEILSYSPLFRYNFYLTVFLGAFNVICNLVLIPVFKLNGAALAALISMLAYNFLKYVIIRRKLNIQPFSKDMIFVLLTAIGVYFAIAWLHFEKPLIGFFVKSSVSAVLFGSAVMTLRLSPDLQQLTTSLHNRIKKR